MRPMRPDEFKGIFLRMKRDFPFGQYAPYRILKRQIKTGLQEGFLFFADGKAAAYCICAANHPNGFVLMSYFAVFDDRRGQGIGSAFLTELKKEYGRKQGIVAEVERPKDARTAAERKLRDNRMAFYSRGGFERLRGIRYSIWNVPMHLMAFSPDGAGPGEIGRAVYEIYLSLMGRRFIHMLKISYE